MSYKAIISLVVSTAVGALAGYVETPHPGLDARHIAAGAGMAVVIALVHLFQKSPVQS